MARSGRVGTIQSQLCKQLHFQSNLNEVSKLCLQTPSHLFHHYGGREKCSRKQFFCLGTPLRKKNPSGPCGRVWHLIWLWETLFFEKNGIIKWWLPHPSQFFPLAIMKGHELEWTWAHSPPHRRVKGAGKPTEAIRPMLIASHLCQRFGGWLLPEEY